MFINLIVLIGIISSAQAPPRPEPPRLRAPVTAPRGGQPYPCIVGIEFVDGQPVLGLICE
jgi:hypothetical protein